MKQQPLSCQEVRPHLEAFCDDLLDTMAMAQVRQHLTTCQACQHTVATLHHLEERIRSASRDVIVPQTLWPRIRVSLAGLSGTSGVPASRRLSRVGVAAVLTLLTLAALLHLAPWDQPTAETRLLAVPVEDLQTFLVSQRSLDVSSADPHYLRQWFQDKTTFLPPLLPAQVGTARLVGGRLCYFLERRVASFMYIADGHYVSLYVMPGHDLPSPGHGTLSLPPMQAYTIRGYRHALWLRTDLLYSLVSDVSEEQLRDFLQRLGQAG